MATTTSEPVRTPVARMVMGNLYKPRTTDGDGRPLMYKNGPKAGTPRADYFFAIAIPKGAEVNAGYGALNWAATPWGMEIYKAGCAFMAHAPQVLTFAWKVSDGDSQVPNTKGRKLSDSEGCKGHWILFFNGTIAPKLCNADGTQILTQIDAIKAGYFVQVGFTCKGNDSPQKPGVYLNPLAVALQGYGEEIHTGVDVASLGFGGLALPAGASVTPLAQMPAHAPGMQPGAMTPGMQPMMLPQGVTIAPPTGVMPAAQPLLGLVPQPMQQLAPPMGVALQPPPGIMPNAAFLQPVALQPVMLQPAAPKMTALAQGTYEQYRAGGATDEQMIAAGVMVR